MVPGNWVLGPDLSLLTFSSWDTGSQEHLTVYYHPEGNSYTEARTQDEQVHLGPPIPR
jgi:hypothetical protein